MLDFTHQMAAVAESGIPIIAGLRAVGDHVTACATCAEAIDRIRADNELLAEVVAANPDLSAGGAYSGMAFDLGLSPRTLCILRK